jgi:hypothetical protein
MDTYYETPSGTVGAVSDAADVPEGATVISQQLYETRLQQHAEAAELALAQEVAARKAQWTLVHDALVAGGVTDPAASVLADVVGTNPAP